MWELINGKLVQKKVSSRVKFRTNISELVLLEVDRLSLKYEIPKNHIIEMALKTLILNDVIITNTMVKPKDRIQYKTTYDKELLEQVRDYAKKNKIHVNQLIEYSMGLIIQE
ncbi:rRNA methyltransferase [Bacillus pinisoli]|uniref:rRNA methyltransferase n=1 Tax=Bacillus pinisoli TaxID=2901866 RepID=UPI001FF1B673|nr:rRNA methyltransferase [Bacillus pinisoli]